MKLLILLGIVFAVGCALPKKINYIKSSLNNIEKTLNKDCGEYQLTVDADSVRIWDGERRVATIVRSGSLDSIIHNDNLLNLQTWEQH